MDDGDIEFSDSLSESARLSNLESSSNFQAEKSVYTTNELLRNTKTCTHTHTCNPPGPDAVHTHTCFHSHTQVFASEEANKEHTNSKSKPRRPSGNREAVRKYREKKKAHTAYLEEEVKNLRLHNHQLVRKLQGQALLQAEILRLRMILVDLKRKIDDELGVFPYKKQFMSASSAFSNGDTGGETGLQCQIDFPCFSPQAGSSSRVALCENGKLMAPWKGSCQPAIVNCRGNLGKKASTEEETVEAVDNLMSSASQPE